MLNIYIVLIVVLQVTCSVPVPIKNYESVMRKIQKNYEKGGFFEGDMRFESDVQSRNAVINKTYRWTNNTVYYDISFEFDLHEREIILGAMNEIESKTCIKFVRRQEQLNYVYIQDTEVGCSSHVGMISGLQLLNLRTPSCMRHEIVLHELLHALGFYHQHSATNRDDYIEVILDNVEDKFKFAFNKYPASKITDFGTNYDYWSIMHYYDIAFSKNGLRTMVTKDPKMQSVIGHAEKLSDTDVLKINLMYNCRRRRN